MRALLLTLAIVVAACTPAEPSASVRPQDAGRRDSLVAAARNAAPGDTIDLRAALGADWDRAVIIGPYTDNETARKLLGFDFDLEATSPWTDSEGGVVVVLANASDVVAWMAVPASEVGLHCLEDASLPADTAVLTVSEEPGGYRELSDPSRWACQGDSGRPSASPTPAPSVTGGDASGFEAQAIAAMDKARQIPRDGVVAPPGTPTCQALGDSYPLPMCVAGYPDAEPALSIWVVPAGSMGGTHMLMAYAGMPDGIEGAVQPGPALGDEARLSRTWSDKGCIAVLAVRDGTLILSVQARLAAGPATTDCGQPVPADYLESVARSLLGDLGTYRDVGLPVDDLAARDRVVKLITAGTLVPGDRDIITLPAEFANLSDGGEVVAMHDRSAWIVVFFEDRGVVDSYAGWVYSSSGTLASDADPLGGSVATMERIDGHWFHVVGT